MENIQSSKLKAQLASFDAAYLDTLKKEYVLNKPAVTIPENIEAVNMYPHTPNGDQKTLYRVAAIRGKELVKEGKVGAFLVAGGQGTRLGYNGPKGEYKVTPVKHKPLFQVFAEQLLAYSRDNKTSIPWYIMTSDVNMAETKDFFESNNYFGYNPQDIFFFEQGMMPAFDIATGALLLADKDNLALSPDGHGGSLRALHKSGALADMKKRGVEYLSYFQVDNPLVNTIDYTFLGLHDLAKSEMSSKTIAKAGPLEKVGNFVQVNGKVQVIEYSDMPEELAKSTNADGSLRFNAGSIAIHILSVSFIERLNKDGNLKLPWHRAEKKVAFMNEAGEIVKPEKPNAVKLEQFIFDAIPFAHNAMVYETVRSDEFSPVKNADGNDSPATSRLHQVQRAARWLQEAGIKVPMNNGIPEAVLEIDPLFAISPIQLKKRKLHLREVKKDSVLYFGKDGVEGLEPEPQSLISIIKKIPSGVARVFTTFADTKENQTAY